MIAYIMKKFEEIVKESHFEQILVINEVFEKGNIRMFGLVLLFCPGLSRIHMIANVRSTVQS